MSVVRCEHKEFAASVAVGRFEDTGRFMADVRVQCKECGLPFRFVGVPAGISWDRPAVSIDNTELHAPIEPETEPRLQTMASFQMPPELGGIRH